MVASKATIAGIDSTYARPVRVERPWRVAGIPTRKAMAVEEFGIGTVAITAPDDATSAPWPFPGEAEYTEHDNWSAEIAADHRRAAEAMHEEEPVPVKVWRSTGADEPLLDDHAAAGSNDSADRQPASAVTSQLGNVVETDSVHAEFGAVETEEATEVAAAPPEL